MTWQAEELAELLGAFAADQRSQALAQTRLQRIVLARAVGKTQVQLETVIDQNASDEEIFKAVEPFERAFDRLMARSTLSDCYTAMDSECNQIDMTIRKMVGERINYEEKNRAANRQRRGDIVGLTPQQKATIDSLRATIHERFERIDEIKAKAVEARRILDGDDPFAVVAEQIERRIDSFRGYREAA